MINKFFERLQWTSSTDSRTSHGWTLSSHRCNVLILKDKFDLDIVTVSAEILVSHVANQLCRRAFLGNYDKDLNQALEALPRFRTGIFVNVKFNKIDGFVDTPELAVFRLLEIPLYHGWMVDPQDSDSAKAFGSKPYNALIEEVADYYARSAGGEGKECPTRRLW
ncbi:hypothetical protein MKX01_042008 [Papaver californicum]|nr:hypothetical protein MKX01_042008 [Papaver californicum]